MNLLVKSKIKICGIKNISTLKCCIDNNVDFFGLIFYQKSPRNINFKQAKALLNYSLNKNILSVGVFVNEKINFLNNLLENLSLDYIQLHGKETNDYIKLLKKRKVKIIKVISIKSDEDFLLVNNYPDADFFLFDYKPIKNELPGGNSKSFDWKLIIDIKIEKPWFLSGGININNIKEIENYAIPYGIDISSGVEVKQGIKNNDKISSLIKLYESK